MRLPTMGLGHRVKRVPRQALPVIVGPLIAPATAEQWHQEHLHFMTVAKDNGLLDVFGMEKADKLESIVYFDQEHGHMVMCCSYCMEILTCESRIFDREHTCHACNKKQTAHEAIDTAYLSLLGIKHANCVLSDRDFSTKTHGVSAYELVRRSRDAVNTARTTFRIKQNLAERKALKLIRILFGEKIYKQIVNKGETWIKGADKKFYRIFWARHGNVAVYQHRYRSQAERVGKDWKPIAVYCGHFGEDYPIGDQIITQICMFQTNPDKYTSQANNVSRDDWQYCGPKSQYQQDMADIMKIEL